MDVFGQVISNKANSPQTRYPSPEWQNEISELPDQEWLEMSPVKPKARSRHPGPSTTESMYSLVFKYGVI